MDVAFQLGPLTISWYGILITLGVISTILVAITEAKRRGEPWEEVLNMALIVVPMGIIGSRLYHVIDEWSFYSQNPVLIIGGRGLGIFGAVIGGAIGLIIYTKWKKLKSLLWMDIVAPGLILAQAIGRWGNFFNQELYGYPTDLPWAIYIDPIHRLPGFAAYSHFHPMFLYESLWNLLGCFLLLFLARKLKTHLFNGDIFLLYCIYYSIGRIFLEEFKIGVWTVGDFPTASWISSTAIAVSIVIIIYRRYRLRRTV
jgi:phosphatidylglycerol:prolipoprotein diacylglycerol transferase